MPAGLKAEDGRSQNNASQVLENVGGFAFCFSLFSNCSSCEDFWAYAWSETLACRTLLPPPQPWELLWKEKLSCLCPEPALQLWICGDIPSSGAGEEKERLEKEASAAHAQLWEPGRGEELASRCLDLQLLWFPFPHSLHSTSD